VDDKVLVGRDRLELVCWPNDWLLPQLGTHRIISTVSLQTGPACDDSETGDSLAAVLPAAPVRGSRVLSTINTLLNASNAVSAPELPEAWHPSLSFCTEVLKQ
jgi:hypothetical protein